jgi:hypothetical protein
MFHRIYESMELGMHPAISCSRRSLVAPMRGELHFYYTPLREGRPTPATGYPFVNLKPKPLGFTFELNGQ